MRVIRGLLTLTYGNFPYQRTWVRADKVTHLLYFLCYVFSSVSSNCFHEKMHSHIVCSCLTFLHCAFSNVSLNCLPEKMQSRIGCIRLTFLHCAFSNVSSKCLPQKRHSCIGCICLILFLQYLCLSREHIH